MGKHPDKQSAMIEAKVQRLSDQPAPWSCLELRRLPPKTNDRGLDKAIAARSAHQGPARPLWATRPIESATVASAGSLGDTRLVSLHSTSTLLVPAFRC